MFLLCTHTLNCHHYKTCYLKLCCETPESSSFILRSSNQLNIMVLCQQGRTERSWGPLFKPHRGPNHQCTQTVSLQVTAATKSHFCICKKCFTSSSNCLNMIYNRGGLYTNDNQCTAACSTWDV